MQDLQTTRIPTGITSLDPILDGGVPVGTITLLIGEIGAGHYEFAYSSTVNLLGCMIHPKDAGITCPVQIVYITFTRLEADVKREIAQSFHVEGAEADMTGIRFEDLSEHYFDRSIVPDAWYSHSTTLSRLQMRSERENIFVRLADLFSSAEPGSMIIIDSVTDIATQASRQENWAELTGFLRGLQRLTKTKNLTVYLLLSKGIIAPAKELELADIADAVFLFRWEENTSSRRQRIMYFEKFRGVMPHLEEQDLVKFAVRISTNGGFEVSNIRMVI